MYYYRRLRDLREDSDKSQREIGMLLGTTQQQYAKYEAGIQEIPTHHLLTLADYYDVSVDYLLGRIEAETEKLWKSVSSMPVDRHGKRSSDSKQSVPEQKNQCRWFEKRLYGFFVLATRPNLCYNTRYTARTPPGRGKNSLPGGVLFLPCRVRNRNNHSCRLGGYRHGKAAPLRYH